MQEINCKLTKNVKNKFTVHNFMYREDKIDLFWFVQIGECILNHYNHYNQ